MPVSLLTFRVPLSVALAALAVFLLVYLAGQQPGESAGLPRCRVYQWTGLHCPGCGSTRCVHALLHARPGDALRKNPLLFVLLPFLTVAVFLMWWNWVRGGKFRHPVVHRWSLRLAPAVLVIVVLFTILRNLPWFEQWLAPH